MSDWGLPNWREGSSYGDSKNWHLFKWRWEFTRRRPDYRRDFDGAAQRTYEYNVNVHGRSPRVQDPGFCANPFEVGTSGKTYGYSGLPNPRISAQPSNVILPTMDYEGMVSFVEGTGDRLWGEPMKIGAGEGQMVAVFDLDKPLPAQILAVNRYLEASQKLRHGKTLQVRRRPEKWLIYLRCLDARESNASWRDIFDCLFSTIKAGNKNPEQEARNAWNNAHDLMMNWPH